MNWYEKIQAKMNEVDESRELKNGDVKKILIASFNEIIPEFKYNCYNGGIYHFSREKEYREFSIYESFQVGFSLKEKNFYCSVSSCFDRTCEFERSYNLGPLNLHKDLIAIIKNSGAINIEDAYYFHNGKLDRTTAVIQEIVNDYRTYGINYLENRAQLMRENKLLNIGLDYIKELSVNPIILKSELEQGLKKANYLVRAVEHPEFIKLKEVLSRVKYGEKNERQYIPKLTYELLLFYCNRNTFCET